MIARSGRPHLALTLSLALIIGLCATAEAAVEYDGVIVGRFNKYDYAPAHIFVTGNPGSHHLWWCSESSSGDEIWYSKSSALGAGGWDPPVKVFGITHSPWSSQNGKHVCDPSVIKGSFPYNGITYTYAMYYTSLPSTASNSNKIGVAFSRTGLNWTAYPNPIVAPSSPDPTQYGAGMSGVAYKPGTSIIQHLYFDSTLPPDPNRLTEGSGGIVFQPIPGVTMPIDDPARFGEGQGGDIAYYPGDQHWYAVTKNPDPSGIYDGETTILRAINPNDLVGPWQVIGVINSSLTGKTQNHNPGLAKNANSTLYVRGGWAYVFFGVGDERPATNTWEIGQARFTPGPP